MSLSVSGKLTFLPERLTPNLIRAVKRHVKRAAELNADMVRLSIDRGKDIVTGGNFQHLKPVTREVRSQRGIGGNQPLYASGKLNNSILVIPDSDGYSVIMEDYGHHHNEGFTVGEHRWFKAGNDWYNFSGTDVPRRRFFDTPIAFFRRAEYKQLMNELEQKVINELKKAPVKRVG